MSSPIAFCGGVAVAFLIIVIVNRGLTKDRARALSHARPRRTGSRALPPRLAATTGLALLVAVAGVVSGHFDPVGIAAAILGIGLLAILVYRRNQGS